MLHKTRGIVVNYLRYRETSIIVKIYTEAFGIQTYIENGVRTAKGKNKIALFQPLTLLDLVVYHDNKKEIHRIAEIKCSTPYQTLPYHILKSGIALFVDEVLNKTLREHSSNDAHFEFLYQSLQILDEMNAHFENFHLIFLLKNAFFLGFAPQGAEEVIQQCKDFKLNIYVDDTNKALLNKLIVADYDCIIPMSRQNRLTLLEIIIAFYSIHLESFGEIKSLAVLREILN